MNIEKIREMRNRAPFRPFSLHLTTGEVVPVQHSEMMAINAKDKILAIFAGPTWNLIDAESVMRISTPLKQSKAPIQNEQ